MAVLRFIMVLHIDSCFFILDQLSKPFPYLSFHINVDRAARGHSVDMANRNYFSHYTPEGEDPGQRLRDAGWNPGNNGYAWSENIAGALQFYAVTRCQFVQYVCR
jgi:hypothetical protein